MKVCLIKLPSPFLIDEKVMPPLGLLAVGTGLKLQGHKVDISDKFLEGYDVYGVSATTPEYPYAVEILKKAPVIIGGSHASMNYEKCFRDGFSVVVGDGERIDLNKKGIIFSEEFPLDDYPIIDRELINIKSYHYYIDGKQATTMVTSRGCPYSCAFCAKSYKMTRYQSVNHVKTEINYIHDLGFEAVMFFDDTFIVDKERALGIGECLKELGMLWRCFVRADLVVKHGQDFIDTLRKLGCVEVGMGIESGSDTILKNINKQETASQMKQAIGMLHKAGIRVKGFFIVGLPGESRETIYETKEFLRDTSLEGADFTIYQPYQGSPITNNKSDYDIDWVSEPTYYKGRSKEYTCSVHTSSLSSKDIINARNKLELCHN